MKPGFDANGVQIYLGDCRDVLRQLPAESVHCCVTSPPYWGLRDYGTASWEGGEFDCDHSLPAVSSVSSLEGGKQVGVKIPFRGDCGKCGATRIDRQIGLEDSPVKYIATMREVFAEVRRVLRPDGTLWLNMGDSYSGSWGNYHPNSPPGKHGQRLKETPRWNRPAYSSQEFLPPTANVPGLKPKDLVGIPWMLAFALREDGWYLRQDIIWAKPNPMPESVTDRCTKSHEYIFLLSKSERYYYNQEAILEEYAAATLSDKRDNDNGHRRERGYVGEPSNGGTNLGGLRAGGRNKRSVWSVATEPFPEAHFATFPQELIKPCILAGCPEGGTVLDPFMGSGTTGLVARSLHSKAIGIELNPAYIKIAAKRLQQEVLDFSSHEQTTGVSGRVPVEPIS